MKILKVYKVLIYIALVVLLLSFFFILGFSISLSKQVSISLHYFIALIILVAMSVTIYILFFRSYLKLIEKDIIIEELVSKLNFRQKEKQKQKEEEESHENHIDTAAFVDSLVPKDEKFTSVEKFGEMVLQTCSKVVELVQGVMYIRVKNSDEFKPVAKYAFYSNQNPPLFVEGETIPGQVAKDKKIVKITDIPHEYFTVSSGLGNAKPSFITYIPVVSNNVSVAVIEISTFKDIESQTEEVLHQMSELLAKLIIKNKLQ